MESHRLQTGGRASLDLPNLVAVIVTHHSKLVKTILY